MLTRRLHAGIVGVVLACLVALGLEGLNQVVTRHEEKQAAGRVVFKKKSVGWPMQERWTEWEVRNPFDDQLTWLSPVDDDDGWAYGINRLVFAAIALMVWLVTLVIYVDRSKKDEAH